MHQRLPLRKGEIRSKGKRVNSTHLYDSDDTIDMILLTHSYFSQSRPRSGKIMWRINTPPRMGFESHYFLHIKIDQTLFLFLLVEEY